MIRQFELVNKIKAYTKNADEDALNRAYVFAMKAHSQQKRASGEPYFVHPLEVANILADLRLDPASIITGLLHDTVEDTTVTLTDIEKYFGEEVASLVDGVTKLSRIEHLSDKAKQAENFRKLLLALSKDMRVLLVKLADRLHNMRTLHHVKTKAKRMRVAQETLDIYAPLAERIGLHKIKDELEDYSFAELHSEARESIVTRLHFLRREGHQLVTDVIDELKKELLDRGMSIDIIGREKKPYSIWRKMRQQNVNFEQLTDIVAFRMIVPTIKDCYKALWIIHSTYPMITNRFKDYISTPKPNGYQSVHTSVFGPKQRRIEIQIRTHDMHDVAEHGVAAHWSYKQNEPVSASSAPQQYRWLRGLLDILEQDVEAEEFLEHTKIEMYQDQVFCFSPQGDLIVLPQEATPVDFAYAIHSDIGNSCIGAKVNGKIVPLRSLLQTGDQIEITTGKQKSPSPDWERFVVTGKAKAHIRRLLNQKAQEQYKTLGRHILQKAFKLEGISYAEKKIEKLLPKTSYGSVDTLLRAVGQGVQSAPEILKHALPKKKQTAENQLSPEDFSASLSPSKAGKTSAIPLKGLIPGLAMHFAGCCHPVPGDKIVGIVYSGRGVTVHRLHCKTLKEFEEEPDRWLDVSWDTDHVPNDLHMARLIIFLSNEPGSLAALTHIVSTHGTNIQNLKILHRETDFYEIMLDLEVQDQEQLDTVLASLRSSPYINQVDRQ